MYDVHNNTLYTFLGRIALAGNGCAPIHNLREDAVSAQGEDTATYDQSAVIFDKMPLTPDYPEFLPLPLYESMA